MTSAIDFLALPFDQYQRYTVAARVAEQVRTSLGLARLRVLDVGGFYRTRRGQDILPLCHFLPEDNVVAVDLATEPLPNYAQASGLALPFAGGKFDLTITCDTLEHVSAGARPAFVEELLRVSSHCLVLIAPFDSEYTRRAEQILQDHLAAQGLHHEQLDEHLRNGLPDAESLRALLKERGVAAIDFADGYLPNWLAMMIIKHTPGPCLDFHLDLDRYYNRHLSPGDRREPAYRRVFVVAQPGREALLQAITRAVCTAGETQASHDLEPPASPTQWLEQSQTLALEKALCLADGLLAETRSRLSNLEAENAQLRQLVAGYEGGRFIRLTRWLHNQRITWGDKTLRGDRS
jgi:hypothetical protein